MNSIKFKELENCLRTPYIDGIIQLIELNKEGLTRKEIIKILDKKGDKLTQNTINYLLETGIIKKNYNTEAPIITNEIILIEKLKPTHTIEIVKGDQKKRHAFIIAQNPITLLFNEYIKLAKIQQDKEGEQTLEELKKEIAQRWEEGIKIYDFNTEYSYTDYNSFKEITQKQIEKINTSIQNEKDLQKKQLQEDHKQKLLIEMNNCLTDRKQNYEREVKEKKAYIQGLILLLREKITKTPKKEIYFHSHIDYIILQLQRLLLEDICSYYSKIDYYVYKKENPKISKQRIELIKKFAEYLDQKMFYNSLFEDLTSRLINFENLIALQITQQNLKIAKTPEEFHKLEKETDIFLQ